MRLFIALELTEEWKQSIFQLAKQVQALDETTRITPLNNLHLTIQFIGEVEEKAALTIKEQFSKVTYPDDLSLIIEKLGFFSNRKGKLLWVGCKNTDTLKTLSTTTKKWIQSFQLPLDNKSFVPHITYARSVHLPSEKLLTFTMPKLPPIESPVFTLFQSEFTRQGVKHNPLISRKTDF